MNDKVIAMSIVDTIKRGRFWLSKGIPMLPPFAPTPAFTQAITVSNHNNQYRE